MYQALQHPKIMHMGLYSDQQKTTKKFKLSL